MFAKRILCSRVTVGPHDTDSYVPECISKIVAPSAPILSQVGPPILMFPCLGGSLIPVDHPVRARTGGGERGGTCTGTALPEDGSAAPRQRQRLERQPQRLPTVEHGRQCSTHGRGLELHTYMWRHVGHHPGPGNEPGNRSVWTAPTIPDYAREPKVATLAYSYGTYNGYNYAGTVCCRRGEH